MAVVRLHEKTLSLPERMFRQLMLAVLFSYPKTGPLSPRHYASTYYVLVLAPFPARRTLSLPNLLSRPYRTVTAAVALFCSAAFPS